MKVKKPSNHALQKNRLHGAQSHSALRHFSLGLDLHRKGQLDDAKTHYLRTLELQPLHFDALHHLGLISVQTSDPQHGVELLNKAIAINPKVAAAHLHLGNALQDLGQLAESLDSYNRAIELNKDYALAYNNRGNTLNKLKHYEAALASFDKAIELNPNSADSHYNRATVFKELGLWNEVLIDCNNAIALQAQHADAYKCLGFAYERMNRKTESIECYERALKLRPNFEFLFGIKLHMQMNLCDWTDLERQLAILESDAALGRKVTPPFQLIGLIDQPQLQLDVATIYAATEFPLTEYSRSIPSAHGNQKIKIAYYSADFYNHATAILMAELFEHHDKNRFEFHAFSYGPNTQDEIQQRVANAFDHFLNVHDKTDQEIAELSRELKIDIAVDLKGFTGSARPGIFAHRCAPIQANYLGYPGTLGAPYIDYIIADQTLIPPTHEKYYSEKVVRLPNCYQPNDSQRKISDRVFTKQELGLPDEGFVFCCFNNNYKILPAMFDIWMRLLKQVNGSVLWLLQDNPAVAINLRKEAERRGVDPDRLVFAPRMLLADHLARHRLADLFLDTFPCNAHTTASDALWAGLPVLTLMGQSFASRVAASLLNALNLPELITETESSYEQTALMLALQPDRMNLLKSKLVDACEKSSLFNGVLFARHLENAFEEVFHYHYDNKY